MTIVEVIPSLAKRAGAEVFLINLSKQLNTSEKIVIVSLYGGIDPNIEKDLNSLGIKIFYCNKKVGIDLKCAKIFEKIIHEIKPDVVHMHLNCVITYFLAFGFKKQHFKTFLTVHSLVEKDFKKSERFLIKAYAKKKLIRVVGISHLITNNIKSISKINDAFTIDNGTYLFDPIQNEPKCDVIKIICVAAFRKEKNQEMLINSFIDLESKTEKRLLLTFLGDGPLLEENKRKVDELNRNDIVFCGQQNDIYSYLKESHIFCLSSKYEGNPISIIEAMSVGLPIVAPKVGGIPDVVKDNKNGELFIVENKDDLSSKLLDLIINDYKRQNIRKNNINDAKQYSIEICASNYLKLFKENINGKEKI